MPRQTKQTNSFSQIDSVINFNNKSSMKAAEKAIDSISAGELLNALKTLENINVAQDQLEQLDISFSQNDNFEGSTPIKKIDPPSEKLNQSPQKQTKKQLNSDQKMNFEFYMSKKQNSGNMSKLNRSHITPRNNQKNKQNKSATKPVARVVRKSTSPLTERKHNGNIESSQLKQGHPASVVKAKKQTTQKTKANLLSSSKVSGTNNQNKSFTQQSDRKVNKALKEEQKVKKVAKHSEVSIHERSKEFLKNRNQKLKKIQGEMAARRQKQQQECTFKPKVLANHNTKPKYLESKKQIQSKTDLKDLDSHKQKKYIQKSQTLRQVDVDYNDQNLDINRNEIETETNKQKCKVPLQTQQLEANFTTRKYKNSKFNVLLDMIH